MDLFNNYLRTLMVKSVTVKYTADISELINEIYKIYQKAMEGDSYEYTKSERHSKFRKYEK